jgi:hypothetical protein
VEANAAASEALQLLDQLDNVISKAKAVPLTNQVRVDREQVYDLLDQLRAAIAAVTNEF